MAQEAKHYKLRCIVCPEGCDIEADEVDGEFTFAKGICKRGQDYARQEIVQPCRVLTTTVPLNGGQVAMLPVRTVDSIPKDRLMDAMQQIASLTADAPVSIGDVICPDIAETGVALHACRTVDAK